MNIEIPKIKPRSASMSIRVSNQTKESLELEAVRLAIVNGTKLSPSSLVNLIILQYLKQLKDTK